MFKLSRIVTSLLAVSILAASAGVMATQAEIVYGTPYSDSFSTTKRYNGPNHTYRERDISFTANNLSSSGGKQTFTVALRTRNYGIFEQFGPAIMCDTNVSGGGYLWLNANPNRVSSVAFFRVTKQSENNVTVAGRIDSRSQTTV